MILVFTCLQLALKAQPIINSVTSSESRCVNSGSITANATGTGTLSYQLQSGPTCQGVTYPIINGTANNFQNLCPGTYSLAVADANGTTTQNVTVAGTYVEPLLSVSSTSPFCSGGTDATVTATITNGRSGYIYNIYASNQTPGVSPPLQTITQAGLTHTFTGLSADSFVVVIIDSCGSQQTRSVVVTNPPASNVGVYSTTNGGYPRLVDSCANVQFNTGISFSSNGAPYFVELIDSSGTVIDTATQNSLGASIRTLPFNALPARLRVTNACGTVDSVNLGYSNTTGIFNTSIGCSGYTILFNNARNFGQNITLTATDGTNTYTSGSITAQGTINIPNVPFGNYTVTATNECGDTLTFNSNQVGSNTPINLTTATVTPDLCINRAQAVINIQSGSGTAPITWQLISSPPGYTGSTSGNLFSSAIFLSNQTPGSYSIVATDACGTTDTLIYTVDSTDISTFDFIPAVSAGCGLNDGTISWTGSMTNSTSGIRARLRIRENDATGNQVFLTTNTNTVASGQINNLTPGDYYITLEPTAFCNGDSALPGPFLVNVPAYIQPGINPLLNIACDNGDVSVVGTGTGGQAPYTFELYTSTQSPGIDTPIDTANSALNFNFSALSSANSYIVRVIDDCGNGDPINVGISGALATMIDTSCDGSSTVLASDFILGANYSWTKDSDTTVIGTSNSISLGVPLSPSEIGTYNLVTSLTGCVIDTVAYTITVGCPFVAAPLPVILTTFNAFIVDDEHAVKVEWSTSSEKNSDLFKIERMVADDWLELSRVSAQGNSDVLTTYSYLDTNPEQGLNMYRLKMVDIDGSELLSEVQSVNLNSSIENRVVLFPNPTNGKLNISFNSNYTKGVIISVVDQVGKIIYTEKIVNGFALGELHSFSFGDKLNSGIYYLELYDFDGNKEVQKFTILK